MFCNKKFKIGWGREKIIHARVEERGLLYCFGCAMDGRVRAVVKGRREVLRSIFLRGYRRQCRATRRWKQRKVAAIRHVFERRGIERELSRLVGVFLPVEFDEAS